MARVKSLLKRHVVETARGKRTCKHTGAAIEKGDICLVVFDGPRDRHPYGKEVARKMIEQARNTLSEAEAALSAR